MYDPINDQQIPSNENKPDSFWASASTQHYLCYQPLSSDITTEVVIVGGGFTGLSTALHLQESYNTQVTLLEANQVGWGASGRNGGFVLPGTGRLSVQQLESMWGKTKAQAIYADYLDSVQSVKTLIDSGIDCDYSQGGYLKLAHKPELVSTLHQQASLLSEEFADNINALNKQEIATNYLKASQCYGGVYYPNAFSVNPWKLCQGIASKAVNAGVTIFGNTVATRFEYTNGEHKIYTNSGVIRAKTLILASNAYGLRKLHPIFADRMFPVMSSILVTKPLSREQLDAIGMREGLMVMDTRPLKYYYRLLPDNRLLFGGRGPIKGKNANNNASKNSLFSGLKTSFPQLTKLEIEAFWSGWVSVSYDDYPRIFHDKQHHTLYAGAYCGAGLAFSIQAGKRLAQLLQAPETLPNLPYWQSPLKRFPLANLRRPALRLFYTWETLKNSLS